MVAEALACGTPCVLSSGCRVPEVGSAGAGIVVDSSDPADYAHALDAIRRDPLPYREHAREAARRYFSLSAVIDTLVSTLTRHGR